MLKYADLIRPLKVADRSSDQQLQNQLKVQHYVNQQAQKAADQTYIKARLARKSKLTAKVLSMLSGSAAKVRAKLKHDIAGYQYDYNSYKAPEKAGDVIIAFSGARQGPNNGLDLQLQKRYGKNNYAIFRPTDVDKAIEFAKTLPEGSKVYVQGLSHGGAAALKFAQSGLPIQRVITYDAVAHFTKPQVIPSNVKSWYNAVAGNYNYQNKSGFLSWLPNWFKSVSSDTAVDYMGRWGQINGAHNVNVPKASHVDVKTMYKELNKNMKDTIMKSANYKYGSVLKQADFKQDAKNFGNKVKTKSKQAYQTTKSKTKAVYNKAKQKTKDYSDKIKDKYNTGGINNVFRQNRWMLPSIYGMGGLLGSMFLTSGMKSSVARILAMLGITGAAAFGGDIHNAVLRNKKPVVTSGDATNAANKQSGEQKQNRVSDVRRVLCTI